MMASSFKLWINNNSEGVAIMKYTHLAISLGTALILSCCSPAPQKEVRGGPINLPVDYINTPIMKSKLPVIELQGYDSAKLVINTNNMFQQNQTPLRSVNFQKYSSEVLKSIIEKIKSYPDTKKIDVTVYHFGNFTSDYLNDLSTIQAQTVCALLWDFGDISRDMITCQGLGRKGPLIVQKGDFTTNFHNNRIEITLS